MKLKIEKQKPVVKLTKWRHRFPISEIRVSLKTLDIRAGINNSTHKFDKWDEMDQYLRRIQTTTIHPTGNNLNSSSTQRYFPFLTHLESQINSYYPRHSIWGH